MTDPDQPRDQRSDALPIYMQISEMMIRDLAAGRLQDGQKLPPERELARLHGTTVRTLRKALTVLQDQGLIERRHGSGNYVRSGERVESVYSMFRLEHANGGGGLPVAQVLSVDWLPKDDRQPEWGGSDHGTRFRRLRFLDRTMIAVEEIWLDGAVGRIPREAVQDSLYLTYKKALKLWITRAEDRVGIGRVPAWSPPEFTLSPGTTTAYIERLSWAQTTTAVEFSRTWYDTEKALYVQRLI